MISEKLNHQNGDSTVWTMYSASKLWYFIDFVSLFHCLKSIKSPNCWLSLLRRLILLSTSTIRLSIWSRKISLVIALILLLILQDPGRSLLIFSSIISFNFNPNSVDLKSLTILSIMMISPPTLLFASSVPSCFPVPWSVSFNYSTVLMLLLKHGRAFIYWLLMVQISIEYFTPWEPSIHFWDPPVHISDPPLISSCNGSSGSIKIVQSKDTMQT